jgi:hypothetical protein
VSDSLVTARAIDYSAQLRLDMRPSVMQRRKDELDHKVSDGDASMDEICEAAVLTVIANGGGTVKDALSFLQRRIGRLNSERLAAFEHTIHRLMPAA